MTGNINLNNVTIGIITALNKENAAIKTVFGSPTLVSSPSEVVYDLFEVPCIGGKRIVALTSLVAMGNNFSAIQATNLFRDCPNIQDIIMVGIAGAIPCPLEPEKHVRLGDLVVSGEKGVYQFDFGKVEPDYTFTHRAIPQRPSPRLLQAVQRLHVESLQGNFPWELVIDKFSTPSSKWLRPDGKTDVLDDGFGPIQHPSDLSRREGKPRLFIGTIGASNILVKDAKVRDQISKGVGAFAVLHGVEMEGAGIADSAWFSGKGFLVIRGISDYCNIGKNDLWQEYAALIAAAFARTVIENLAVPSKNQVGYSASCSSSSNTPSKRTRIVLNKASGVVDSNLGILENQNEGIVIELPFDFLGENGKPEIGIFSKESLGGQTFLDLPESFKLLKQKVFEMLETIKSSLDNWDFSGASEISNQLHKMLAETPNLLDEEELAEASILFARVAINKAETEFQEGVTLNLDFPKVFLTQAERQIGKLNNTERKQEVEALRVSLERLEFGNDIALKKLINKKDPFSIRTSVAIYLIENRFEEAMELLKDLKIEGRWCDLAVSVFGMRGNFSKAREIVVWAKGNVNKRLFHRCVFRFAEALFSFSILKEVKAGKVFPHILSDQTKGNLKEIQEVLSPIISPLFEEKGLPTKLEFQVLVLAWKALYLLGNKIEVQKILHLLYPIKPVPLEVARGVLLGLFSPPGDLPDRLRNEHPNQFDHHFLASIIQCCYLNQPENAFKEAKNIISWANLKDHRGDLFKLFHQIWQELPDDNLPECEKLISKLVETDQNLKPLFEACWYLRLGMFDEALEKVQLVRNEDDFFWLQLYSNVLLQKGQKEEATEFLLRAAKQNFDIPLLQRTANLALETNKTETAIWCLEQIILQEPENLHARNNLAFIYFNIQNDLKKSAEQFQILYRLDPSNINHALNAANAWAQLNQPQKSMDFFDRACSMVPPPISAVIGRAQLLESLGKPKEAIESLQNFQKDFWEDQNFLLTFVTLCYKAGAEELAHQGFEQLNKLRLEGKIDSEAFRVIESKDALEVIKSETQKRREQFESVHTGILKGETPWILGDQILGSPIFWGWRWRTREFEWINEEPCNLASLSIYATNGFHVKGKKRRELQRLTAPSQGLPIVVDLSALFTLFRLGLLRKTAEYFGEIWIPSGYLKTVLPECSRLHPHQLSQKSIAEKIKETVEKGLIQLIDEDHRESQRMPMICEYSESNSDHYRFIDVFDFLFEVGVIDNDCFNLIKKFAEKPSNVNLGKPKLKIHQDIAVEKISLDTLVNIGLFKEITSSLKIHFSNSSYQEILQVLETFRLQEETQKMFESLWNNLQNDSRFRFDAHFLPPEFQDKKENTETIPAFFSFFLAQNKKFPLLVDDRVCQVYYLNGFPDMPNGAFGTENLLFSLFKAKKLSIDQTSKAFLQLVDWRYKFLLPIPEILFWIASRYKGNPPGEELKKLAKYVQDCMSDPGLFGGAENTATNESMAIRLFISWGKTISEFLVEIWKDATFSAKALESLTEWSIRELLPTVPRVIPIHAQNRICSLVPFSIFSQILLKFVLLPPNPIFIKALESLKNAFALSNENYSNLVLEILQKNETLLEAPAFPQKLAVSMQKRMADLAFSILPEISLRTFRLLQQLGLDKGLEDPVLPKIDLEVVADSAHKARLDFSPGPLIFHNFPQIAVLELPKLLFYSDFDTRATALTAIEELVKSKKLRVTPKTEKVLAETRSLIQSENPNCWRKSSVTLLDAFDDDFFVSLAGLKQCLKAGSKLSDLMKPYWKKVFFPSASSIDTIKIIARNPELEHMQIQDELRNLVQSSDSLCQLCSRYFERFGFLPFMGSFGLPGAVKSWLEKKPDCEVWKEVWAWAKQNSSLLGRYHALTIFINHPYLIPGERQIEFWKEILEIFPSPGNEEAGTKALEPWYFRRDLVRHYSSHLEVLFPGSDNREITSFAWWLTEQVSTIIGNHPETCKFYRENWIKQIAFQTALSWEFGFPVYDCSNFHFVTQNVSNPWHLSLLGEISQNLDKLSLEKQGDEVQKWLCEGTWTHFFVPWSFFIEKKENPTFSFEFSLQNIVDKISVGLNSEEKQISEEIIAFNKALKTNSEVLCDLKGIGRLPFEKQLSLSLSLKAKVFFGIENPEEIWEIMIEKTWLKNHLCPLPSQVLLLILESFQILQIRIGGKWLSVVPHVFSEICESVAEEEKRITLFFFLLQDCIRSNTFSAVKKLLDGKNSKQFREPFMAFKEKVSENQRNFPPLVFDKMRCFFARLGIN